MKRKKRGTEGRGEGKGREKGNKGNKGEGEEARVALGGTKEVRRAR